LMAQFVMDVANGLASEEVTSAATSEAPSASRGSSTSLRSVVRTIASPDLFFTPGGSLPEEQTAARVQARLAFEETGVYPPGCWQFLIAETSSWVDVDDLENAELCRTYLDILLQPTTLYQVNGVPYESDLRIFRRKHIVGAHRQALRYRGVLPFDPPEPPPGSPQDSEDVPFAARFAAGYEGLKAEEACAGLAAALASGNGARAAEEMEVLVKLLDSSLTYERCVELRLGKMAGQAQKELEDERLREAKDGVA
ncbi:unnamed protein product, partial [Polarella glacialis]